MKPPIHWTPIGTTPRDYLNRARMFLAAAIPLPQYVNGEQNWPAYALLLHACELALKAFCRQAAAQTTGPGAPGKHDLTAWYQLALQHGLVTDPQMAELVDVLADVHGDHYARYPNPRRGIPDLSFASGVTERLISTVSPSINRR
jgi:hypothetical protein